MRIAISALSAKEYGGKTYFRNLFPALGRLDTQNEYHIFIPRGHSLLSSVDQSNFVFHQCLAKNQSVIKRFLWEQFILPRELKKREIDVLFTAKNLNVFFAPCKTVIAIRNTEPFKYREYQNDWKLNVMSWIRWQLTQWSVRKADYIVAVSQYVKTLLRERFPSIKDKVGVVYNGNPVSQNSGPDIRTSSFILTASKFVSYANQLNLLRGYVEYLKHKPDAPPLWFAGGIHDKKYFTKALCFVKNAGIENHVKFLGLISHGQLLELIRQARVFVFPSTLEACPHTLIEAMACGAAIVASETAPMPEICVDAALYFNPFEPEDIANKIEKALSDESLRNTLGNQGIKRAKYFTWDQTARSMIEIFKRVINYNTVPL